VGGGGGGEGGNVVEREGKVNLMEMGGHKTPREEGNNLILRVQSQTVMVRQEDRFHAGKKGPNQKKGGGNQSFTCLGAEGEREGNFKT